MTQIEEKVASVQPENDKNYFFNLIVPCHNPEGLIHRLFDSLTKQNIPKDDLLIIVVDDNSDNLNYREKLKEYDFNILFTETNVEMHCPGNTRRKGMEFINGKWLFFCDQDDFFEPDSLKQVKEYINDHSNETIYVVSTIMRGYNDKIGYHQEYRHQPTWLHGKWYSIDNLIRPYNINFKKDLYTHEDIYFNSSILNYLFRLKKDWHYLNINTYCWYDNPNSLSRTITDNRGYLFENFNDYLISCSDPYWDSYEETREKVFLNQLLMALLHAYFYYEGGIYYDKNYNYDDVLKLISNYIHKLINTFPELSLKYIVDFVSSDPIKYNNVLRNSELFSGPFVPEISFKDFIYTVAKIQ